MTLSHKRTRSGIITDVAFTEKKFEATIKKADKNTQKYYSALNNKTTIKIFKQNFMNQNAK